MLHADRSALHSGLGADWGLVVTEHKVGLINANFCLYICYFIVKFIIFGWLIDLITGGNIFLKKRLPLVFHSRYLITDIAFYFIQMAFPLQSILHFNTLLSFQ
jgi:hypothetical protein